MNEWKRAAALDLYYALQAINLTMGSTVKAKHPALAEQMYMALAKAEGRTHERD